MNEITEITETPEGIECEVKSLIIHYTYKTKYNGTKKGVVKGFFADAPDEYIELLNDNRSIRIPKNLVTKTKLWTSQN